jgi:hypothetical protein
MQLTLELATKGFVSSFEEEEYELTKIFYRESYIEVDDDEENEKSDITSYPEKDSEIIYDEEDTDLIREYF